MMAMLVDGNGNDDGNDGGDVKEDGNDGGDGSDNGYFTLQWALTPLHWPTQLWQCWWLRWVGNINFPSIGLLHHMELFTQLHWPADGNVGNDSNLPPIELLHQS